MDQLSALSLKAGRTRGADVVVLQGITKTGSRYTHATCPGAMYIRIPGVRDGTLSSHDFLVPLTLSYSQATADDQNYRTY